MFRPTQTYPTIIVLLLCAGLWSPRVATGQSGATPRFMSGPCGFRVGNGLKEGTDVRCGTLQVPENRAVRGSRIINLAVAVFKSGSFQRRGDPIFYLNGGPGGAALQGLGQAINADNRQRVMGDRDMVLIDQRGTGLSKPYLGCPEVERQGNVVLEKHVSLAKEATLESAALKACRQRLMAAGIDLRGYTTLENAHDIADLRVALGYTQINLYGVSYGTRLALSVMRNFPAGIRSVILDSVYAPGINVLFDPLRSTARAFNLVFHQCAAAPTCGQSYPRLQATLIRLVKRLDADPPTVPLGAAPGQHPSHIVMTGEQFLGIMFAAMYVTQYIPQMPKMIDDAAHGDLTLAVDFARTTVLAHGGDSAGMYFSVECGEDGAFATTSSINAAARSLPKALRKDLVAQFHRMAQDCRIWHVPAVAAAQRTPVTSAIPTLVLENEFDPITPPSYGRGAARTLSHGFLELFPGLGHGAFFLSCPHSIANAFLNQPTTAPDAGCIAGMSEPFH